MSEQFLLGRDREGALAADGRGKGGEVRVVALVGRKRDALLALLIRTGGGEEIDFEHGLLNGAEDGVAAGAVDFKTTVSAGVGLEGGGTDNAQSARELENGGGVVLEGVVLLAVVTEEGGDAGRAALETGHGVDEVAAHLEHLAAGEAGPIGTASGFNESVHHAMHLIDVAEPAGLGGFEGALKTGVVAPHVTGLDLEAAGQSEGDEAGEGGGVRAAGFFNVDMLARLDGEEGVGALVGHVAFDGGGEDGRIGEDLVALEEGDVEGAETGAGGGVGVPGAAEGEVGGVAEELGLGQTVGVTGAEEGNGDGGLGLESEGEGEEVTAEHSFHTIHRNDQTRNDGAVGAGDRGGEAAAECGAGGGG